MEKISEFLRQFGIWVVVGGVGCGILIYGLWEVIKPQAATVEIVKGSQSFDHSLAQGSELGVVVVDVAGAVEKPGVYKLPTQSRIGDALVLAGGLSATADREWVARTLNLAEKLEDGEKVYIPRQSENSDNRKTQSVGESDSQKTQKVNLNTASIVELDSLEGIGEARAQAIVANRPYGKIEEVVSKAKIPESVYEKIRDNISVY